MSFSADVKNELCKGPVGGDCCARGEAYGLLLYSNQFAYDGIRIITENPGIRRRIPLLMKKAFSLDVIGVESAGGKTVFEIREPEELRRIFEVLGYDYKYHITYPLNRNLVEEDCCRAAFLRGIFLMGGTVAAPEKKCHLEIATSHQSLARQVMSLMLDMNLSPKITVRKTNSVLYFKDTSRVEDFLTLIGAPLSSMAIMEAKVEKALRNSVNRQVNCETANLIKASSAAAQQIMSIQKALDKKGMDVFPPSMQKTVQLRLQYPSVSLAELAALSDPPLSKPGISHRLKRIVEIAEKSLQEEE